ncbi:MAG: hypothetical protein ACYC3S_10235 [Chloroflexota bacterium]
MRNRRGLVIVAAMALAVVLAVGAAGSALAFGPWGQGAVAAQAQTPRGDDGQPVTCPLAGDPQTAQAMQDAMQNGDFEKMRDLMGANAGAMGQMMEGANFEQMQEWMRNGDYDAMREFMGQQGVDSNQMMGSGHSCGSAPTDGRSGMMGGANNGTGMMGGANNGTRMMGGAKFGGMMGGR